MFEWWIAAIAMCAPLLLMGLVLSMDGIEQRLGHELVLDQVARVIAQAEVEQVEERLGSLLSTTVDGYWSAARGRLRG